MEAKIFRFLKIVGVGYKARAEAEGRLLYLKLGYSHLKTHCAGTPTMFTSDFLVKPRFSKNGVSKTQSAGNQRHKSSLVGTSETTCATTYPKSFCEWLAGIIDGDGSIQVNKQGYTSLEITMGLEDLRLLRYIQHMLCGSIKMRAGAKVYRYRLHNQLGFFDADGTIVITMKDRLPQLSIQVTNKLLQDVESYKVVFGGNVYFDSSKNGCYQWSVQSRKDVIVMLDYFKSSTFRSHKSRRFFLIEEYYSLYDLKAFKPDSIHHKAWLAFLDKWNKLMI
ncbi:intron-encoded DNA endonuclease aI4-like isoform X3 [Euphorbia lathyris]|uniref:intron-encoded DNA endonuclease aI4-like isoform X3 n=1 Tax=Euphorbia lathyris TaxID=212925 RepID=UPI003313529E